MDGRVSISARALERTVAAVAAGRMGVPVRDVSVRLSDDSGLLGIAVTGPLTAKPLRSAPRQQGLRSRTDSVRSGIRDEVSTIAGSTVGTVSVEVSRIVITQERRVL